MTIKLLDTKKNVVDSIACEYEDSFTLESFQDMIETAHAADKCFIIARVSTADPKQPDKSFYSYYNAYQLNKVLFQTQVIKGKKFIHRLHVLNPLSNLDIQGDVLYFQVKPIKMHQKADNKKDEKEIIPTTAAVNLDANSPPKWTLAGPVCSPLTEEFPQDYVAAANRSQTYPIVRQMVQIRADMNIIDMNNVDGIKAQIDHSVEMHRKISMLPLGVATRFNSPVSKEDPQKLNKGNRRAFSWMNSKNSAEKQLSFIEWKELYKNSKTLDQKDCDSIDMKSLHNMADSEENSDKSKDIDFEAVLFATDNDYLEQVKTRSFFKANAISSEDVKLFEMPTVEDVPPVRYSIDEIRVVHQPGKCCQYCGSASIISSQTWIMILIVAIIFLVAVSFILIKRTGT